MRRQAGPLRKRAVAAAGAAVKSVPRFRRATVRRIAAAAALVGLVPLTATRVALNSPLALPAAASGAWFDIAAALAPVGPALGAALLGVTTADDWTRIGLVLAGVFGLLSAVTPTVAGPAVGAIVVGGWLALVGQIGSSPLTGDRRRAVTGVAGTAILGGVTLSLFGAAGVRPATLRPAGAVLALAGMAATPLAVRAGTGPLAAGGVAAAATFAASAAAPFTTGAVALIAGSVIGAPVILLAAAVGGLTATITEGIARRRAGPVFAGFVLLAAGVPSSIPRALGAVLAVTFVAANALDADTGTDGSDAAGIAGNLDTNGEPP